MKETRTKTCILRFMAVSPREAYSCAALKAGGEKAFSAAHHPGRSDPAGQSVAAACRPPGIPAKFRQAREFPSARESPAAGTRWIAFPRLGVASSRLPPLREHCPGIFQA